MAIRMRSGGGLRRLALLASLVVVLLGGWGPCADAAESFLTSISRNLRAEMSGVLEMAVVNYSKPVLNATYSATFEFDMRAMGPIYNSTHTVIDAIAHQDAYPEGTFQRCCSPILTPCNCFKALQIQTFFLIPTSIKSIPAFTTFSN